MSNYILTGFSDEIAENFCSQLNAIKTLSMQYIEIRGINGKNISSFSIDEIKMIKEQLDQQNIKVSSIGSPIGKIFIYDDFDKHFDLFKKIVEFAKILNTKYLRIFSFYIDKDKNPDHYEEEVIKRLKLLLDYASNNDIILLHENEKDIYGDIPERCLNLVNKLNSNNFKLIFDFANFVQCSVNTNLAYSLLKKHITYFHIKDALKNGTVVPCGAGEGNIYQILRTAKLEGYKGFLSLEPHLGNFKGLKELELNLNLDKIDDNGFERFKLAYDELNKVLIKIKENTMVKFGIVGIGHMGSTHARNIQEGKINNASLVAVCDIDEKRLLWANENLDSNVKKYKNYDDMLLDENIDAIIVATPHYDHPIMAIKALNNGFHVLIEKPAGVYTKAVKELNDVAKKHPHLTFGIMLNQRTNPIYRKAKELVENGDVGEIKRTNWIITDWYRPQAYYNQGGWRATWKGEGGGVLANQDPHQLDLWQWICGMPKTIRAFCYFGKNRKIEVENDVTAFVEYDNGATGIFVTSTHDYPGTNRFEISGDKGQIIIEHDKLIFKRLKVAESIFNQTNKEPWWSPGFTVEEFTTNITWGNQHNEILNNFTLAILNNEQLLAKGEEGIKGLTIANAMLLSTFINQTIDVTNLDEELFYQELLKRING